jgi:hypothetical protein
VKIPNIFFRIKQTPLMRNEPPDEGQKRTTVNCMSRVRESIRGGKQPAKDSQAIVGIVSAGACHTILS